MNPIKRYFNWLQKDNPVGDVIYYPKIKPTHETEIKGLYIVGDLSGLPLLRFAAQQGYQVVHEIAQELKKQTTAESVYDLIIIGAGPAGISAGLEAKKHNLKYLILEGARIANTIVEFPKGKLIFAEPKQFNYQSQLPIVESNREEMLTSWYKLLDSEKLNIRTGVVKDIQKQAEYLFEILLEDGEKIFSKRVVLAIGKSGKRRQLDIPGELLPKVTSVLRDPAEYYQQKLLIIGGGDSAIETACALADTGNEVTLSYRRSEFTRLKSDNLARIQRYQASNKLTVIFNSTVQEITETDARIKTADGEIRLANDMVFVMIGKELPYEFLKRIGISIENSWSMARAAMFALSTGIFSFVYFGKHYYHSDLFGQSPGFWYSLLYTLTVGFFGIKRMIDKPDRYIRKQTITLFLIQAFPLFFIPFFILPYMGEHNLLPQWVEQHVFPGKSYWLTFALVFPWPLFIYILATDAPINYFWITVAVVQSFVLVPVLVRYWGKGAICGWICSCGALAETLGDSYRNLAPHGEKAKRWEHLGQVILAVVTLITISCVVSWFYPSPQLREANHFMLKWYNLIIEIGFEGALALGMYFFFSGRIWCRYGCPLAALMHIYAKFTKYRIFSDKKKCISCGVCTKNCHMGIDVASYAVTGRPMDDVQCVSCAACVVSCPMDVLSFGSIGKGHPHDPATTKPKGSRSLPILPAGAIKR